MVLTSALAPGGAVAHRNLGNIRASFLNDAAGLGADAAWQRSRLLAGAEVDVCIVEATRMVTDAHLARSGPTDLHPFAGHDLGTDGSDYGKP
jgi:hypothetical protein